MLLQSEECAASRRQTVTSSPSRPALLLLAEDEEPLIGSFLHISLEFVLFSGSVHFKQSFLL